MVFAASPGTSRFSPSKEQAEIRALRQAHNRALAAYDVDDVVRLATDEFAMILGGGHIIHGKAAYRDFVAAAFAEPHPMLFVRTPDRIDVGIAEGGPVAAETGRWVGTASDGGTLRIAGRYLVHWTKPRGQWQIASETYVTVN